MEVVVGPNIVDQLAETEVIVLKMVKCHKMENMKNCWTYQVGSIQLGAVVVILREILLVEAEATLVLDALIQRHFVNFQFPSFSIICKKGEVLIIL